MEEDTHGLYSFPIINHKIINLHLLLFILEPENPLPNARRSCEDSKCMLGVPPFCPAKALNYWYIWSSTFKRKNSMVTTYAVFAINCQLRQKTGNCSMTLGWQAQGLPWLCRVSMLSRVFPWLCSRYTPTPVLKKPAVISTAGRQSSVCWCKLSASLQLSQAGITHWGDFSVNFRTLKRHKMYQITMILPCNAL